MKIGWGGSESLDGIVTLLDIKEGKRVIDEIRSPCGVRRTGRDAVVEMAHLWLSIAS